MSVDELEGAFPERWVTFSAAAHEAAGWRVVGTFGTFVNVVGRLNGVENVYLPSSGCETVCVTTCLPHIRYFVKYRRRTITLLSICE